VADDGTQFESMHACKRYERELEVENVLDGHEDVYWRDTCPAEVSRALCYEFVLIRKGTAEGRLQGLARARDFISGFEDDPQQEGVRDMLDVLDLTIEDLTPL
jgi:hypothetical protein